LAGISPSALLRASRRIQEMSGCSGDLCACPGRLYTRAFASRAGRSLAWQDARLGGGATASSSSAGAAACGGSGRVADNGNEPSWVPLMSLASFKVVASPGGRFRRRRFGISVESRLPLGQREGQQDTILASDCGLALTELGGTRDVAAVASGGGLNTSGPMDFPIEVALDARLLTTGLLGVPADPSRCDLGADELALVWAAPGASGQLGGGGGGGGAGDELGDAPIDAVVLPESVDRAAIPIWDRSAGRGPTCSPRASAHAAGVAGCGSSAGGGSGGAHFAFVFDGRRRSGGDLRGEEQEMPLTPLDSLYLARLCAYDDSQLQDDRRCTADDAYCPPHVLSSDEVLDTLLQPRDQIAADLALRRSPSERFS